MGYVLALSILLILLQVTWCLPSTKESLLSRLTIGDVTAITDQIRSSSDPGSLAKIINGVNATKGSIPHQVSLRWILFGFRFHLCGACLIEKNVVLTAAHCVYGLGGAQDFEVAVYEHNLSEDDGTEQIIAVERILWFHDYFPYIDFHGVVAPHDIALLILTESVRDDSAVIPLADDHHGDFLGQSCMISGWGLDESGGTSLPDTLQVVNMTVLSQEECLNYYASYDVNMYEGQICIFGGSNATTGAAACNGDSGGPMVCNGVLAGVTSWGVRDCRLESGEFMPTVYTRVSYYYPWIKIVLGRFGNNLRG